MTQNVGMGGLGNSHLPRGFPQGALGYGFKQMMTTLNPRAGFNTEMRSRENPLLPPLTSSVAIFAV
jgi:hypothetical protein